MYRKEADYNFRFNNMDKVLNKIKGYYWVSTQLQLSSKLFLTENVLRKTR